MVCNPSNLSQERSKERTISLNNPSCASDPRYLLTMNFFTARIEDLENKLKTYETKFETRDTEQSQHIEKLTVMQKSLQDNQSDLELMRTKLHETETLYKKSLATIASQSEEIESLKLKLDEVSQELVMKTDELCESSKRKEIALEKEIEKLKEVVKTKDEAIDQFVEQVKDKDRELVETKVMLKTVEHEIKLKDEHIENHVRTKREAEAQFNQNMQEAQMRWQKANAELEKQKVESAKQLMSVQAQAAAQASQLQSHVGTIAQLNMGKFNFFWFQDYQICQNETGMKYMKSN